MHNKDSHYQIEIYNTYKKTKLNIAVEATAGAGKTTTILRCLQYVPKIERTLFCSFSNAIVKELQSRVPSHIKATTLHSQGFSFLRDYYSGRKFEIKEEKYLILAIGEIKKVKGVDKKGMLEKKDYRAARLVQDVCNYARMTLTPFEKEKLMEMCLYYNIDFDDLILDTSLVLLKSALKVPSKGIILIDFTDMIYMPIMNSEMIHTQYDNIFLDEAQDTNAAQLQLIELLLKKDTGRLISVGDSYQSIYGFSGADVNAFKRIQERPNTIVLPLSISYRCPKKVVRRAQEVCPTIQPWEEAEEGDERVGTWDEIKEGDMVLSRLTKPLISLYFLLLERGVKVRVVGKDIESGLIDLVESTVSETFEGMNYNLEMKFEELENELRTKYGVKIPTEHQKWRALFEKVQVIRLLMKKVNNPNEIVPLIHEIFREDRKAARLMTIHRSKGLENDRVFVIEEVEGQKIMPSRWAKQQWEHVQENNLIFVARTRSKRDLIFINLNDN